MSNNLNTILIFLLLFCSSKVNSQMDYRDKLQATFDSIVKPYEVSTGADFGPGLAFTFKEVYEGIMRSSGTLYTGQIDPINFEAGDTISLLKAGVLGSPFVYGKFESHDELAILSGRKINDLVSLQDSLSFWNQFDRIKKVKVKEFAQYWVVLNCEDRFDTDSENNERVFWNIGKNSIVLRLQKSEDRVTMVFDFSISHGKDLKGLGCADDENTFVEFKFDDGEVVRKYNTELENCQSLKIDISKELDKFEKTMSEIKFSMSKKEKVLIIDHELSRNHINVKMDCLLD